MIDQMEKVQTVDVEEGEARIGELVSEVAGRGGRVLVTRDGQIIAALISARELAVLDQAERKRKAAFKVIDEIQAAFADLPGEELEREIAKALAEVRAEMRAEAEHATGTGSRSTNGRAALLARMRAPFRELPYEAMEREVSNALAEVRREMLAEREQAAGRGA